MLPAIRAELTKMITLRSAWLVMGAIVALHLLAEAQALNLYTGAVSQIAPDGTIEIFIGQREPAEPAMVEALVASALSMSVFLPLLAAVLAGQEFRGHQLGCSLLAVPRRGRLLAAKTLAAALCLLVAALLIAGISATFNYLAIRQWKPELILSSGTAAGVAKFLAYAVLLSLVTFAITLLARSTLVAIFFSVLLVALTMSQVFARTPALDALLPFSAGRNLLLNPAMSDLSARPGQAALVLAGWAVVTVLGAALAFARRDAR